MASPSLLHTTTIQHARTITNRLHILFHLTAVLTLLYHRITTLLQSPTLPLPIAAITVSELLLAFLWFLSQSFRWRFVSRSVFPEKIPQNADLPSIDVFICTADPKKEPTVEVMNTVLSAMAIDYPVEKLAVYLSDDAAAPITLYAMREGFKFAKVWIPFCEKYGIKTTCPQAFFSSFCDDERIIGNHEFSAEEELVKSKYEVFQRNVEKVGGKDEMSCVVPERAPIVEIINDNETESEEIESDVKLPLLVYVSRERIPSFPHRFKAGALNTLLRVSGLISNGSYLLVLDCDMYCNDPSSARQAMCFILDPQVSNSLAFVQFPQIFYNVSKNDIYDGQARSAYKTKWQGMDGLRGSVLSGTGYYLKRTALFGSPNEEDKFLNEPEKKFGSSDATLQEARRLATCAYETNTKWGKEIGYSYESLLESTFTGYLMHCKGWIGVYLYPKRPCFLGCTTIDMKDALVQLMKWSSGLFQIGLSKYCPLTYGMSRMSILQSMCYGYFTFSPLFSIAFLLYAIVPQLCLLQGIPLYPKVSDPWFAVFATVYISSLCQHLHEVLSSDGSLKTWWNEQRSWIMKSVTGSLFGVVDVFMKWMGIKKASFRLTNKAIDKEKLEKYEKGKFDFSGAAMFMVPLTILVMFNLVCFFGGVRRVTIDKNFEEMFGQIFLCFYLLVLSYPILEGIVTRKSKGKP